MANMFRESERHITPISLEDSVKTDKVINNLWSWAAGLETLGKILFVAIIVIGVITAITSSFYEVPTKYGFGTNTAFDLGGFILKLIDCALYAFIEYCAYHIIALLVGALASITQHTKATAKIMEYNTLYKDQATQNVNQSYAGPNQWKCSKCGRVNDNYVGTCGCGNIKYQNNNSGNIQ